MSMQYEIKQNQTLFDVAIELYGRPEFAVKLVNENPDVISLTMTPIAGIVINYDEAFKVEMLQFFPLPTTPVNTETPPYQVKGNQSQLDLATMWGYGIEGLIEFMQRAELPDLTQQDIQGQIFSVTKKNTNISNYLNLKAINFGTAALGDYSDVITTGSFVLLESGDYVLLESGDKIEIE